MNIKPGINEPALEYLRQKVPNMTNPGEKVASLFYDETKIDERVQFEQKNDCVLGPSAEANQIMVRSLGGDWKVPIYTVFDKDVTKEILDEVIIALETIGIHVLLTVCDQGGKNLSLPKVLNISPENITFPNPYDKDRVVIFTYDFVHTVKNFRYSNYSENKGK